MKDTTRMDRLFEMITDTDTDEEGLLAAMQELGAVVEPPGFWTNIANSHEHAIRHRRLSVFCLFGRHVKPRMRLSELATMLKDSTWFNDEDITVVEDLGGHIPVQLTHDDTVFVLSILPTMPPPSEYWAIFLRVSGRVDRNSFVRLLRGGEVDEQTREAFILEVGFVPPNVTESRKEVD